MSVQAKLALALAGMMAAAVAASALAFMRLYGTRLKAEQGERADLVAASAAKVAEEAVHSDDALMLVDYLYALRRERPELVLVRVRVRGSWEEVGPAPPPEGEGPLLSRMVETRAPDREGLAVEMGFSPSGMEAAEARNMAAVRRSLFGAAGLVALAAAVVSWPLGRMFTRRIVDIQGALEKIGGGALDARLPVSGSDEIGRLAQDVNLMAERLRELEGVKKTFVASVTHELRSPLGVIEAHVARLLSGPAALPERAREDLQRIRRSAARLGNFVTNLLETARLERGQLKMELTTASLAAVAEDAVEFFRPQAEGAGLALEFAADPGLPLLVLDPQLISQVLANLLSNAVKFTRKGGRIGVEVRASARGQACVVSDSGVGIAPEGLGRVFQPFERVRNKLRASGAGLGLSIAKAVVEMHGGVITVSSTPGKGTVFRFELPERR